MNKRMNVDSFYNNADLLDNLFSLIETITNLDWDNKLSVGKQIGIFQDLQDIISEINVPKIVPDFSIRLGIHPRHGWKDRDTNTRIFNKTTKIENRNSCSFWICEIIGQRKIPNYENINILTETGDSIYSPDHESKNLEYGPRTGQVYVKSELIQEMLKEVRLI
jgi:hypothetical protein